MAEMMFLLDWMESLRLAACYALLLLHVHVMLLLRECGRRPDFGVTDDNQTKEIHLKYIILFMGGK